MWVVCAWLCAAAVLFLFGPVPDDTPGEAGNLLPAGLPADQALQTMSQHFGDRASLSSAVITFERAVGILTPDDQAAIETLANQIKPQVPEALVRTPGGFSILGQANPLLSADGHAALVTMSLPYGYATKQAARTAHTIQERVFAFHFPSGLSASVTGSAGYGYDYGVATQKSHDKTALATMLAVVCILLAVYRAPLAAGVLLGGISLAAFILIRLMVIGERFGLHGGMAEQIFTFVLLYGTGIDYSLLVMSRYREFLQQGLPARQALTEGLAASQAAILSSATMTISGLAMLCFAQFSVFKNSGPAVVLAIATAALASITLIPALLAIAGTALFWPGKISTDSESSSFSGGPEGRAPSDIQPETRPSGPPLNENTQRPVRFWTPVANVVVNRPRTVLLITLICLLIPAVRGMSVSWNYDALFSLKASYPAPKGTAMIDRHWPTGEIAPITMVLDTAEPLEAAAWSQISEQLVTAIRASDNVQNIRAISNPLGLAVSSTQTAALKLLAGNRISAEYLSADKHAMRMDVVLKVPPLSRAALDSIDQLKSLASQIAAKNNIRVQFSGLSAEMIDLRALTRSDFTRVSMLAVTAILLIVVMVLQDVLLAIFIVAATALSYLTTLGLCYWTFSLFGTTGIEWKVQMLLFVVLVAVGQDYSIFFTLRYAQESRTLSCKEAVRQSLIHTGPVISSCGLIMAATLGSVAAGDVTVLVQLGFAFALGMLIDTFIVRPLLLPSFILITRRTLRRAAKFA